MLEENIEQAMAHGYAIGKYFSTVEDAGCFMPPDYNYPNCHPLETIILGQAITDCINKQIAEELGVSLQWVDGFVDGYAGNKRNHRLQKDRTYLEGYKHGYEVDKFVRDLESERDYEYQYGPD
jgi:hypothetical protein